MYSKSAEEQSEQDIGDLIDDLLVRRHVLVVDEHVHRLRRLLRLSLIRLLLLLLLLVLSLRWRILLLLELPVLLRERLVSV